MFRAVIHAQKKAVFGVEVSVPKGGASSCVNPAWISAMVGMVGDGPLGMDVNN